MKYALISEDQIKQIQDAVEELMYSNSTDVSWGKFKKVGELLGALRPQEPVTMPDYPERVSLADVGYAQNTPENWDEDYARCWQDLQVMSANFSILRKHIRELRAFYTASLRQELSKPEQEAVAEIVCEDWGKPFNAMQIRTHFFKDVPPVGTKLYTAPLANPIANQPETSGSPMNSSTHSADSAETFGKREWVWLTDDDRIEIAHSMDGGVYGFCKTWGWLNYAKALEAKSKEKNA